MTASNQAREGLIQRCQHHAYPRPGNRPDMEMFERSQASMAVKPIERMEADDFGQHRAYLSEYHLRHEDGN